MFKEPMRDDGGAPRDLGRREKHVRVELVLQSTDRGQRTQQAKSPLRGSRRQCAVKAAPEYWYDYLTICSLSSQRTSVPQYFRIYVISA
jgi:hypothetical protein